ncbi:MAG: hypothetical protein ERJ67_05200 [Aphanocapsa feldmannii 277cV]|uniref:Uncharacterized protein n=2 Tax=Aphanocapsa feldmannii TaxID=192050 RepID=A0A524RNI6_9CHRO|nr:MAG: hypothetical protein ERJ69_10170 [Aphanocapsa feldmannii 288cV]TGG92617.1 MAG: hypothetical protein ERJ67_05200 [Aphanocapsa feldmannii 277cV]TGH27285.1 MAG: hypothetical protein ERJ68_01330 [Aphanocapsa feldmannii 277cI]
MAIRPLLDEELSTPPIAQTAQFRWYATSVGIAALWTAATQPGRPPYDHAIKEGLEFGLDLSREEWEWHQVADGLVLLFHS